MKHSLLILVTSIFCFQAAMAESNLNLDGLASREFKKIYACRESIEGCTSEQELHILQIEGKVLSPNDLQKNLDATIKNKEKSFFIPLSLNNQELLALAAATSLGVVAFSYDQEIMDTVQNNQTTITKQVETVGNFLGTGAPAVGIAAGSYFLGVFYKDSKLKQVGLFMIGASVANGLITTAVKETFARMRPNEDEGPYRFFEPGNKSFWSGHTSQAFTVATVISEMYKEDHPIVPYIAYGVASITAYARMHDKAHWSSDVITGAIAGHLITKLFLSSQKEDHDGRGGLEIFPSYDIKTGTIMLVFEYKQKMTPTPMQCSKIEDENLRLSACIEEVFAKTGRK